MSVVSHFKKYFLLHLEVQEKGRYFAPALNGNGCSVRRDRQGIACYHDMM